MERRLRTVEEAIRTGSGNFSRVGLGPHHQRPFIRPGRPDMSHVGGATASRGYVSFDKK